MPMYIKILGPATKQAEKLLQNTAIAVKKLKLDAKYEKINEFRKVIPYGMMALPALVIDGKVVSSGIVLEVEEAMHILEQMM